MNSNPISTSCPQDFPLHFTFTVSHETRSSVPSFPSVLIHLLGRRCTCMYIRTCKWVLMDVYGYDVSILMHICGRMHNPSVCAFSHIQSYKDDVYSCVPLPYFMMFECVRALVDLLVTLHVTPKILVSQLNRLWINISNWEFGLKGCHSIHAKPL